MSDPHPPTTKQNSQDSTLMKIQATIQSHLLRLLKNSWLELTVLILGLLFIHVFLLTNAFHGNSLTAKNAADFGTFIGGYIGNIFGVLTVALLIMTLREQIRQYARDNFERRFFQLLAYHRENVAQLGIRNSAGMRSFVLLIREFRATLEVLRQACGDMNIKLSNEDLISVAYVGLYYGTGPNSTRMLEGALANSQQQLVQQFVAKLSDATVKSVVKTRLKLEYTPFEGHQSRLGHYFRHLYQMVTYVDRQGRNIEKNEYIGILRGQLSNHEQALLSLNALSTLGNPWIKDGLIERYSLIKNIPRNFFDPITEIDIKAKFPGIHFEYEDQDGGCSEPNREVASD
jgi:hypothetical protein